jgi:hypothetical protein
VWQGKQVIRLLSIGLSLQELVPYWRLLDDHFNAVPIGTFNVE